MNIINTASDLNAAPDTAQKRAFLQSLLNNYIIFDDAEYPEDYDRNLRQGDEGYIEPVIRQEWNSGDAASWGFSNREQIESLLD